MARFDLTMPKMGESVAEATLVKWCKNIGDQVEVDETILEIATDKVDSEVPSPKSGILIEKLFPEEAIIQVGAVFGVLETEKEDIPSSAYNGLEIGKNGHNIDEIPNKEDMEEWSEIPESAFLKSIPGIEKLPYEMPIKKLAPMNGESESPKHLEENPLQNDLQPLKNTSEERFYSPLVREIARKEGLSLEVLDQIKGSGMEGRVTKQDILYFIENRPGVISASPKISSTTIPESESRERNDPSLNFQKDKVIPPHSLENTPPEISSQDSGVASLEGDEIIAMDRMRRLISEHMVMSKNVSAHVTSFVEADVTNIVRWREKIKVEFQNREKENLTYTPIFIEAVAKVLRNMPMVNVSVKGNSILVHKHIHIGMATALPGGNLIVPVVKDADLMSLLGLTKKVNELANKARMGKLSPDDTQGGTFTITNVGTFGNLMGTPIINQPQVAILATGAIIKKPAVLETEYGDIIAIRHKLFLSLSYDHRVVDGALGGSFLRKVADELEAFNGNREI